MSVNLEILETKLNGLNLSSPDVKIVESILLKKEWAKNNNPTYWLRLYYDSNIQYWMIGKEWKWKNKDQQLISGTINHIPSSNSKEIARLFEGYLSVLITEKDYVIIRRIRVSTSPVPKNLSNINCILDEVPWITSDRIVFDKVRKDKPKEDNQVLIRKGKQDWW